MTATSFDFTEDEWMIMASHTNWLWILNRNLNHQELMFLGYGNETQSMHLFGEAQVQRVFLWNLACFIKLEHTTMAK